MPVMKEPDFLNLRIGITILNQHLDKFLISETVYKGASASLKDR